MHIDIANQRVGGLTLRLNQWMFTSSVHAFLHLCNEGLTNIQDVVILCRSCAWLRRVRQLEMVE
jgi:hypothetical protein